MKTHRLKKTYYCLVTIFLVLIKFSFAQDASTFLFVGSYTDGEPSQGIHVYSFDKDSGALKLVETKNNLVNVSFLALSPNGRYLYACTEARLQTPGSVASFEIDSLSGKLKYLNKQTTFGKNPVHVTVDNFGKYVVTSNYTDPVVNLYKCEEDGSLVPATQTFRFEGSSIVIPNQKAAHMHSSYFSSNNKYLFSMDLGSDKIRVFTFDAEKGQLHIEEDLTVNTTKGAGPRHFTFHPNDKFAYCLEELSGTVTSYSYDNGRFTWIDSDLSYSKTSEGIYGAADIHVSPDGKFVYASNRLKDENTIAIFCVDQEMGKLALVGHQKTMGVKPRGFVIDPTGKFLLAGNMESGTVVVFKRDLKTGLLSNTNNTIEVNLPASLKMRTYYH
ncbi:lactonase family protein [Flavivirga sp. 57AJ16]|uniref:lactonase family protein n=1 Tax=Flavivirga sp. 57AJ16 TaxID=3025307 RepID=UPI0023654C98|nr:lactonase family protein [Flavivirga sp. 57AJ16]MDD7885465.1 lactonase family protein [Flavivirga sp. 57AJ16]